ncbi:VOC family protein [Nibrella viscosa]|uniref:VOC family protein n=1 Tax=Nibrella viscosa TaxID=1084524 RepID=A0ABP8KSQ7_9BACT
MKSKIYNRYGMLGLEAFLAVLISLSLAAQPVRKVGPVGIIVSDMNQALAFYTSVLPFEKVSDTEMYGTEYEKLTGVFGVRLRVVRLKLGEEQIDLVDYLTPGGRPNPPDTRSNDLWFQHLALVVSDMDKAYAHLRQHNVQHVSTGPQTIPASNQAAAGVRAFYFRDPDGHNLELIYFPPGKGDPRWQQVHNRLFLGIDHTAIAVSNTANSLKFYQDLLGFAVKGESHNVGTEQAHLNNVPDAELHISGLRSGAGPGIEFLKYIQPRTGRPYPADARADDLFHWYTTVVVDNAGQALSRLRNAGYAVLSAEPVAIPNRALGVTKGFLARDPDGHALLITEQDQPLTTQKTY